MSHRSSNNGGETSTGTRTRPNFFVSLFNNSQNIAPIVSGVIAGVMGVVVASFTMGQMTKDYANKVIQLEEKIIELESEIEHLKDNSYTKKEIDLTIEIRDKSITSIQVSLGQIEARTTRIESLYIRR